MGMWCNVKRRRFSLTRVRNTPSTSRRRQRYSPIIKWQYRWHTVRPRQPLHQINRRPQCECERPGESTRLIEVSAYGPSKPLRLNTLEASSRLRISALLFGLVIGSSIPCHPAAVPTRNKMDAKDVYRAWAHTRRIARVFVVIIGVCLDMGARAVTRVLMRFGLLHPLRN